MTKRNNYGWIGFFIFIVVASAAGAGIMIWWSLELQMKPEDFAAAKKRWQDARIKNYNLDYKKRLNSEERWTNFSVKVRGGKVQEVLMDGKPLEKSAEADSDPRIYHSMDAQFSFIQRFLDIDQKPGAPRAYVSAVFDPATGAVLHYVRRLMAQRVELDYRLEVLDK